MPWIFRSPDPVVERLQSASSDEWRARQHATLMSPGDLVFFWEGDDAGRIVGVGRIQTQAYRAKDDQRKMLIRVGRNLVLSQPVTASECKRDSVLADVPVLQRPDQMIYGLSRTITSRLIAVIGAREQGFAEAMNLPKDAFPEVTPPEKPTVSLKQSVEPEPQTDAPDAAVTFGPNTAEKVAAFLADPEAARVLALRRIAYTRLRRFLTPEVLADVTTERFTHDLAHFGAVILDDERLSIEDALTRLEDCSVDDINQMAESRSLLTEGNLTWSGEISLGESDTESLRLRAGLAHLLNAELPLRSRVARMRRSVAALWPETATGILMILDPAEHITYHRPAVHGLNELGVEKALHDRVEDYDRYRMIAKQLADEFGFDGLDAVDLFLTRQNKREKTHRRSHDGRSRSMTNKSARFPDAHVTIRQSADEKTSELPNEGQAVFALYQHLRHSGIVVSLERMINLYLSLKTIPMLALQGPTGTGKNLVIRAMAEASGASFRQMPMTNESGSGSPDVPIRLRDLFGNIDSHSGKFRPEPWYDAVFEAHENPERAVIICVDTFEGWQEEAWFSEWLRVQDTRRATSDRTWVADDLLLAPGYRSVETTDGRTLPGRLPLPDNLFLVLTAMGDDGFGDVVATHSNVVEFGLPDLNLDALRPGLAPEVLTPTGLGRLLVAERPYRDILSVIDRPWVEKWNEEIEEVAQILEGAGVAIGYRVRDDILRYLAYADDLARTLPYGTRFAHATAFDYQLSQRIVPRLVIKEPEEEVISEFLMYTQGESGAKPRFPQSTAQIEALQHRFDE